MNIIKLIQQAFGDTCKLCPPLDEKLFDEAQKIIPNELLDILKISNGIEELMTLPDENGGKPFVMGNIVYSFDEIKSETECFIDLYGDEGTVFAGNDAGGFLVLKPDGTVYLYEYTDVGGEYYAASLFDYFAKF